MPHWYSNQTSYIREYDTANPSVQIVHIIGMDSYKDFTSISAFTAYNKPRRWQPTPTKQYGSLTSAEFEQMYETQERLRLYGITIAIREVHHDTLDDFYKHIGYDKKTKKYAGKL